MAEKNNNVPLWLTLGFVGGCAFGWLMFREPAKPALATVSAPVEKSAAPAGAPKDIATLAAAEQYFQKWGGYAIWENHVTQFAVWNGRKQRHADFYEVRRVDAKFYFRTLPQLSWVLLDHGPKVREPIWFAETAAMRAQFYQDHPDYDQSKEPEIKRPPRPPIGFMEEEPRVLPDDSSDLVPGTPQPVGYENMRRLRDERRLKPPTLPPPPVIVLTPGASGG